MSKVRIVVDSSTDLPKEIIERYKLDVVPLNVSFGEESFVDGLEIDIPTFYARMKAEKDLPKTSCPSPEKFKESYKEDGDVLVITLAQNLSGTYSAALMGKSMYLEEYPQKRIEVVEGEQASTATGLLAIKAARMLEEGSSMDDVLAKLEVWKREIVHYGALDTLENAIKGGRVNRVAGSIVNALNFKAIIHVSEGYVKPIDKARGEINSMKKVIDNIEKGLNGRKAIISISHGNSSEKAEKVKKILEERLEYSELIIAEIGPVIGVYASDGAILVAAL